jgi:hypothetical protein
MRTTAWRSYTTWAALGSWTCLRHPWELHVRHASIVFGGGIPPPGYVAPYPELFRRLARLAERTLRTLERHGIFAAPADASEQTTSRPSPRAARLRLIRFRALLDRLAAISSRQLAGLPLENPDRELLEGYGDELHDLHFYSGTPRAEDARDDMPMAVLLYQDLRPGAPPRARYVAVGRAMEIFVIREASPETTFDLSARQRVELPRRLQLYRGATLSLYEVDRPLAVSRLTDARWKALLDSEDSPGFPPWTSDFVDQLEKTP